MLKKLITVAATSAALFAGVAAMSSSADAGPRHHWRPWRHGHGHMFMTPVYNPTHCVWRHRWQHGHRVNVRVCRAVY